MSEQGQLRVDPVEVGGLVEEALIDAPESLIDRVESPINAVEMLDELLPVRFEPSAWLLDEPLREPVWLLGAEPLIRSCSFWRSPICPSS